MLIRTDTIQTGQIIKISAGHFDLDLYQLKAFIVNFIKKHWINALLSSLLMYVIFTKDVHFSVRFNEDSNLPAATKAKVQTASLKQKNAKQTAKASFIAGILDEDDHNGDGVVELLPQRTVKPLAIKKAATGSEANLFDNVSIFVNPEAVAPSVVKSKQTKCWDYISRYINVAKVEKDKFGIPVSITLAQGLLESDAGESRLTRNANNHFGIKTFNKNVPHVVMKDDTPTDKFKKYNSAWESYRDHSLLLMRTHYNHLQYLSKNDYVGWAKGLQKAGYATDKHYAQKLIKIIENLKLFRFDEA